MEAGVHLEGRRAEAFPSDPGTQGAGGSPLPPWAAAWEEPGDITRQVTAAGFSIIKQVQ